MLELSRLSELEERYEWHIYEAFADSIVLSDVEAFADSIVLSNVHSRN